MTFLRTSTWLLCALLAGSIVQACASEAGSDTYVCRRASGDIIIDGKLDDAAWKDANKIELMVAGTDQTPISKTEGKILWDDKFVYVGYKAYDKDVWGYFKTRDQMVCLEDVLEFFFMPSPTNDAYYNFEINMLGTIYDGYNRKKGAGGGQMQRWNVWNCEGAKVSIHVNGTANDSEDVDDSWQMELAVPFAELPSLKGKAPSVGDVWTFHLARYDYSVYLPTGCELSSSVKLKVVDFHQPQDWQSMKFGR